MKVKNNLTIIIPTLNNVEGLKYLTNYFKEKPHKVVIVDNKKKNLGFAGGVNKGAKDVTTKWMLILNDDIIFQDQRSKIKDQNDKSSTLENLVKYAEKNKLDAVTPVLRNPDGKVENYGYRLLPIGKIQLIKEIPNFKFQETNMDGITAACLLIKTSVFKKLGGFDENFFAYLEDVDFFLRLASLAQDMSFGIAYDIEVLHNHMTTSKKMGNFKAKQDMVNWWRLYLKHPKKFKFNLDFIVERLRNISGFIKASL